MESVDQIDTNINNSQNFLSQTEIEHKKYQIVNQVGIIYAIGIAIISQVGEIYFILLKKYFTDFFKTKKGDSILVGTLIVNQIFGTLLMFLMTKFIKKLTIKKCSYGCKKFLANIFVNEGLTFIGFLLGHLFEIFLISIFIKKKIDSEKTNLDNSNIFLNILVTCITAPIAEELMYRKFLIDRLSIYSKTLAIFSSGIMFGIFHTNFQQIFGAMFGGWALAYAYAETGNILLTIFYHIYENSFASLITFLYPKDKINRTKEKICVLMVFLRLLNGLIGIIILIIYRKKIKVSGEENKSRDKWKFFKSYGMWIFIIEGFVLSFILYMSLIIVATTPNFKFFKYFFNLILLFK